MPIEPKPIKPIFHRRFPQKEGAGIAPAPPLRATGVSRFASAAHPGEVTGFGQMVLDDRQRVGRELLQVGTAAW